MSIEYFKDLIEIQSLELKIKSHLDKIAENNGRISFIEKQRQSKIDQKHNTETEIGDCQKKISQQEKVLFDLEGKLENSKQHMAMVTDLKQAEALEHEVKRFESEINDLQEQLLQMMENQENLEESLKTLDGFISGSIETLQEIQSEVDGENQNEQKEIDNYQKRINLLRENVAPNFLKSYDYANKLHPYQSPMSLLNQNECSVCRATLDRTIENNVSLARNPESCPSCSRLLFPIAARS